MRLHCIGIPHTITRKDYLTCAFTQKVWKFCKMMTERGHHVIHYGHELSDVPCTEHVSVLPDKYFDISYGKRDKTKQFYSWKENDLAYLIFKESAAAEIHKRIQKDDIVLPFFGDPVKPVCDSLETALVCEPGIGYGAGHFAPYKVFESYAILHAYYGLAGVSRCHNDWRNIVIPNYFDPDDFEYNDKKDDFVLFLGRVYQGKGIDTAIEATRRAGRKLIVAGQMPEVIDFPDHVKYVGVAGTEMRKDLLSKAAALIAPSEFVEPFGGVQVEALLSGTPTITSDIGAFVENNHNGVTGYRCQVYDEFYDALMNIDKIDPKICRSFGEQFLLENVAPRYERFFERIIINHGKKRQEHASRAS